LDRLCQEHIAYLWILGGVTVNYHTLADFRVSQGEFLDQLLSQSVASWMAEGLVRLERTAPWPAAWAGRTAFGCGPVPARSRSVAE
jgi:hypothetical protein